MTARRPASRGPRVLRRGLLALAALAVIVLAMVVLPVGRWTAEVVARVRGAGALGMVAFGALYIGAALTLLPGSALTLGAGLAYGPVVGVLIVGPVSVLAATLAFLVARGVGRGWVERRVAADPHFARLQRAIAARGFRVVLLLRLSPLFPYSLLNYALGLSGVRTRDYVLASAIGMLPGSILYVYLGSLMTSVSALASGTLPDAGPWRTALYWGGLACSIAVTVVITRIARAALRQKLSATVVVGAAIMVPV